MITTKKTLDLLIQLADGLSTQFGNNCEIVIHDLTRKNLDNSIAYIVNGHVSNRKLGDGASAVVIEALKKNPDSLKDELSYLTKTNDGRILKSSTMYIRDEKSQIQYIFSMNYDITGLLGLDSALQSLISTPADAKDKSPKRITNNVNDILDDLIEQSVELIGKPVALMTKDDKVAAIRFLNEAGAFLITKSGDKVSTYFDISKFTLYNYLDAAK
ncbi:putative transcriptional regulator YheO [Aequitasia blattaphilus]|uniref:Helix-turn-helix transcriptional regulator n=1 Tax=Aequitasia blattaphilus TaxID=2949332 RepID=A0ABT1EBU1_9FIRM|nr:helix-turn-helix transcriptional regulator [Aequitasia blattaphilus]MCP1102407.1 helix-turn-helix transcriptional regulator [Aequitasia blattaphilus]MCR8615047.1 helix-turn-helix transcriptional regulator [Aequitasia blattaphilus]